MTGSAPTGLIVAVALEVASYEMRGVGGGDTETEIEAVGEKRGLLPEYYADVLIIVPMLKFFADAVRVAERQNSPIMGLLGEPPFPAKT